MTSPAVPVRNSYFYGELLDAAHLQLEQDYLAGKRALVHRLALGAGVVAGLPVAPSTDGTRLVVGPGLALDAAGREIVVTGDGLVADPYQPTDGAGNASGNRLTAGVVTLAVAYAEQPAEPAPVYAPGPDGLARSAPSVVRERPVLVVTAGAPAPPTSDGYPPDVFAPADGDVLSSLRRAVAARAGGPLPSGDPAPVPLARVTLPAVGTPLASGSVDETVRDVVFSAPALAALLAALAAARPPATPAPPSLEYLGGDAQQGAPGAVLETPLAVRAVAADGTPVSGVSVTFGVRGGAGAVSADGTAFGASAAVTTGSDGTARARWRLDAAGLATAYASVPGTSAPVVFVAMATPPPPADHPSGGTP